MSENIVNTVENAPVKKHRKPLKKSTRKAIFGYAFVAIWVIGFAVFTFYPFLMSIVFAFSKVKFGQNGMELQFVQFQNFTNIFALENGFNFLIAVKSSRELRLQNPISRMVAIVRSFIQRNKLTRFLSKSLYTSKEGGLGLPSNTLPEPPNTSINFPYFNGNTAYKM